MQQLAIGKSIIIKADDALLNEILEKDKRREEREVLRKKWEDAEKTLKAALDKFKKSFSKKDTEKIGTELKSAGFIDQYNFFKKNYPTKIKTYMSILSLAKNEIETRKQLHEYDLKHKDFHASILKHLKDEIKNDINPALENLKKLNIK